MLQSDGYLIFLDMDNLKKINDIHGHKAGDRALKLLGNLLSRYSDEGVACRLGGDEFLLFLPEATHDSVTTQMQELFDWGSSSGHFQRCRNQKCYAFRRNLYAYRR